MKGRRPPILCIVGKKNSGKTTLTVGLAAELKRRGRRVMTVKHGHGFQLDEEGRDSWRHRHEGGAVRTVMAGPSDFAVMGQWPEDELPLAEMVERFLGDADIVLAEGFIRSPEPKIEVFRGAAHAEPLLGPSTAEVGPTLALVTDSQELDLSIPTFPLDEVGLEGILDPSPALAELADFVERTFLGDQEES
jgi:molybdopterin-guanine dinucleotide biosynthesis protein MobB